MSSLIPPESRWEMSLGLGDHDQAAGAGMDDVVDALAQGATGRDDVQSP